MDRLTTLDAGFLHAEDADRRVSLAIGGLVIIDGPMPDFTSLLSVLGRRIGACPRFAQRLRVHAFDYDKPEWVDDADFDLAHHVKRIALPAPGDDHELYRLVAEVMAWRLDRSRPLWEIWVVEGLSENRWAMLLKVHHCIADAVTTAHIVAGLSDEGIGNGLAGHADSTNRAGRHPTMPNPNPLTWTNGLWQVARGAVGLLLPSAPTSLNGPVTNLRRYSAARVPMDDVRRLCRVFDVTVTDVALAALTDSYRAHLMRHGQQPSPTSLRTLLPAPAATLLPFLPVEQENPVQQLRTVHARLSRATSHGREARNTIVSAAGHVPFPITAWAVRLLTRMPQRSVATLATTSPVPIEPLHIMGCKVTAVIPIPPIAMQVRAGVSVLSYAEELSFGILADFDAVPDIDEIARGVETAVRRLVASSKRRKPARDRRGLSLVVSA